jgi:hypothetical protein
LIPAPFARAHSHPLARRLAAGIIAAASLLAASGSAWAQEKPPDVVVGIPAEGLAQIRALLEEKASRSPAQRKIDSQLIFGQKMARGQPIAPGVQRLSVGLPMTSASSLIVDASASVSRALLQRVRAAGIQVLSEDWTAGVLRLHVTFDQIDLLASLPEVTFIQPMQQAMTSRGKMTSVGGALRTALPRRRPFDRAALTATIRRAVAAQAITQTGSVNSEGDATHRAATARSTHNVNGTAVRIGVLSDGVRSLAQSQASGDLPSNVTVVGTADPCHPSETCDEGTAMLEIIHDLAPGAQLFFASAFTGLTQFADNIRTLRNTYDCDIIVDDVFYFVETPFQDGQAPAVVSTRNGGVVIQAVKDVVANGAMYFSSAGNSGNLDAGRSGTWEGDFVSTGPGGVCQTVGGSAYACDLHNFGGGQTYNLLTGATSVINLYWSDPLGGSNNDYDLFLLNDSGTTVLASSTGVQSGSQDPYEEIGTVFSFTSNSRIVVALYSGSARFLHLATNRGRLQIATAGQIHGHAATNAANAFGVAATPAQSPGPYPNAFNSSNLVEAFSSDGPRRIIFQANGTPITPGNLSSTGGQVLNKPDLTAADGVSVSGAGGFDSPFYGTSAAAPHAAAIAALIKSADHSLTASQVRSALVSTAIDIHAPGVDRNSGAGIVMADPAVLSVLVPLMAINAPTTGSSLVQPFTLGGWAIDRRSTMTTGVDAVHVWAFPASGSAQFVGAASYGGSRPDIATRYGSRFANSGFSLSVTGLAPGTYTLVAYARSTVTGTFNQSASVGVTIPSSSPAMAIDQPAHGSTVGTTFTVSGWAVDRAATNTTGVDAVHVYAFPSGGGSHTFLGAASYGGSRPDVGDLLGGQFTNSGYSLEVSGLSPGSYQVVVYARSSVIGSFNNAQSVAITIPAPQSDPVMVVDMPQPDAMLSQPFAISGWAVDLGANSGTGVDAIHVWAFPVDGGSPIFVGAAAYGASRPDVAEAFGSSQFTNCGYNLTVGTLLTGEYRLQVFARSTVSGTFNQVRVIRVTVDGS